MVEIEEVEPAAPPTEQAAERRSDKNWLAQMAKQAESIAQPDACLPVADGMALDQLLTKMRVAADMEYAHVMKDKTEQSLRTLGAEALWEVSQHVYAHAEEFVVQFKHRWREENAEFADRGLQFQQVRQGWHYLLTETETASVLVTTDRRHVIEVQGVELSVCGRLREQYPEAKLPALVYVTLLPWQGRVSWDGVLAYHAVPDKQREMLHKQLWPVYHQAVVVDHKHKLDAEKLAEAAAAAEVAAADAVPIVEGSASATIVRELTAELADRAVTEKAWPGVEAARSDLDLLPTLARDLKRRGDKATGRGELRLACDLYTACLDTGFPRDEKHLVYANRSMCYLKRGEPGAALNDAMAATIDAKEWPKGWARLAQAHRALGELTPALEAIEEALRLSPDDAGFAAVREELMQEAGETDGETAVVV